MSLVLVQVVISRILSHALLVTVIHQYYFSSLSWCHYLSVFSYFSLSVLCSALKKCRPARQCLWLCLSCFLCLLFSLSISSSKSFAVMLTSCASSLVLVFYTSNYASHFSLQMVFIIVIQYCIIVSCYDLFLVGYLQWGCILPILYL